MSRTNLYQKYNFARRPDWRWERVSKLASQEPIPGRCGRFDDDFVRGARNYILKWRPRTEEEREILFYENHGMHLAYQMFEEQTETPDAALFLQGRLLAGMDYDTIAQVMHTHPAMIEWYDALFFNVTDRLRARDWITDRVLMPAMMANFGMFHDKDVDTPPSPWQNQVIARPFKDASLKMFAYFGGPVVCEYMISGFQQGKVCQSPDGLAEWMDGHWAMTIRARSAQAARTFEINKFNVMELFQTHARIMEIEKSSDALDQKRTVIERHVGALIGELQGVWGIGDDDTALEGTDVPKYDASAAELRDDELLLVSSGGKLKQDGLEALTLPPAKKKGAKDGTKG
jgi:hypothetical protein